MTAFLNTIEKGVGDMADSALWTGISLVLFEKVFREHILSETDSEMWIILKQTLVVSGINEAVRIAHLKGWLPTIFGGL